MRDDAVAHFLLALGVEESTIREGNRGWINSPCPLGPYLHESGADTRPSFGIWANEDHRSSYFCFGCSPKPKHIGWLLHNMWVLTGEYPTEAAEIYSKYENHELGEEKTLEPFDAFKDWQPKAALEPLELSVLRGFPILQGAKGFEARRVSEYLEIERGIPERIQNMCRLRYNDHKSTIVFPMTNKEGDVFLLRERSRKAKRIWTVSPEVAGCPEKTFPKLRDVGAWFGMHLAVWTEPVMLVEGELDAMRLMSLGYMNAISSATTSVTDAQLDTLVAPTLILGFDADKAGTNACKRVASYIGGKAVMYRADWSIVDCKDPGDLQGKEELRTVLSNLVRIKT